MFETFRFQNPEEHNQETAIHKQEKQERIEKRAIELSDIEKEKKLETGEIVSEKELQRGEYGARFVEIKDDGSAIFKEGIFCLRERAAYLVDRSLNLNLVPTTAIRENNGKRGSAQEFIPNAIEAAQMEEADLLERYRKELIKLLILDLVIWNTDRHEHNFLIKGKKIYAIDNGLSFLRRYSAGCLKSLYDKGVSKVFDTPIPAEITQNLTTFVNDKEAKDSLRKSLLGLVDTMYAFNEEDVEACMERIEKITSMITETGMLPRSEIEKNEL